MFRAPQPPFASLNPKLDQWVQHVSWVGKVGQAVCLALMIVAFFTFVMYPHQVQVLFDTGKPLTTWVYDSRIGQRLLEMREWNEERYQPARIPTALYHSVFFVLMLIYCALGVPSLMLQSLQRLPLSDLKQLPSTYLNVMGTAYLIPGALQSSAIERSPYFLNRHEDRETILMATLVCEDFGEDFFGVRERFWSRFTVCLAILCTLAYFTIGGVFAPERQFSLAMSQISSVVIYSLILSLAANWLIALSVHFLRR